jgi:putative iron-dependent peroxidase
MPSPSTPAQPGILAPVPPLARYLFFTAAPASNARSTLKKLAAMVDGDQVVAGLGQSLVAQIGRTIPGLKVFPRHAGPGVNVPSTPGDLWCWLRGKDRGEVVQQARRLERALAPALRLENTIDAFRYQDGRDLTGYEDGTENPHGKKAVAAAIVAGQGRGHDGSSFVAVQQWVHDLDRFEALPSEKQDHTIGRRRSDNEELEDAPASAHVKRTAQESFDPEAFVLRRSMPWADARAVGLVFVAFGRSCDAYEAQSNRMVGAEDGIVDALFSFTRPVSGGYFWCPPIAAGHLDLTALGL